MKIILGVTRRTSLNKVDLVLVRLSDTFGENITLDEPANDSEKDKM